MKKLGLKKNDDGNHSTILNRADLAERKEQSKNHIVEIMKNDFYSSFKNPIVILLLLGVILLPSLYGLVNIYACWNPYENTDNVQFAIANEDEGATYQGDNIAVGDKLVDSLKDNTDFKWEFVSSNELRNGVHDGKYYAGIIIPKNFSESVVSITTSEPHSAELEYIVNEKTNPVAAKLTDAAAKAVYNKLNAEIVSFIDVAAIGKLGELQEGLSTGADKMENGADQLSAGADKVASGADQLTAGADKVSAGSNKLASGAGAVSSGANSLAIGSNKLSSGADKVAKGAGQVADGTQQIADKSNDIYETFLKIKKIIDDGGNASKVIDDFKDIDSDTSKLAQELQELDTQSNDVSKGALNLYDDSYNLSTEAGQVAANAYTVANRTHDVSNRMNNVSTHMSELREALESRNYSNIHDLLEKINNELNQTNQKLNTLNDGAHQVAGGSGSVASGASELASGSQQLADGSSQLASGAYELSDGVHVLANGTIKLANGAELLGYSSASALRNASNEIGFAAEQLSAVTDLDQDQVGDYFFSPVILRRHEEFPTNNYGSQVSPFYLVLSMWVGALISCVMLRTNKEDTKYKPHEVYLGKLLLFNIMAILQTTVTLIGCYILGIDISNHLMFMFSCYFVAVIFMALMYSLISVFGEVGKGIAILLLVFQISGSGGIYPVEIMNTIFGILYPYLPMTHGINIVREAQLGLLWNNYLPSFAYLLILGVVTVILALLLKQRWGKRTKYFEDKLGETDLFH